MPAKTEPDLIDLLTEDHRDVRAAFERLESASGATREELLEATITALVQHSVIEEQLLYPLARRMLPDGDEHARHDVTEHAEVERLMKRLERLDAGSPEHDTVQRQWVTSTVAHIEEEERDLFPRLRAACDPEELLRLAGHAQRLRRIAPTRPHPATPDNPLSHATLGPLVGLVDRVRDAVGDRRV